MGSDWDKAGKESWLLAWKPLGDNQYGTLIKRWVDNIIINVRGADSTVVATLTLQFC